MDIEDNSPNLPPMPYTTKKKGKRTKHPFGPKQGGIRKPNAVGLIYRKGTDCQIADEATEARLSRTGPSTSTRLAGYNFIWGELSKSDNQDKAS